MKLCSKWGPILACYLGTFAAYLGESSNAKHSASGDVCVFPSTYCETRSVRAVRCDALCRSWKTGNICGREEKGEVDGEEIEGRN